MTTPRARRALDGLGVFSPPKPASVDALGLAANENPFPPLPGVAERAAAALGRSNRYPDANAMALRESLGVHLGIQSLAVERIRVGAGSGALLSSILQAYVEAGDEVVFAWRSFEGYPIATALAGGTVVSVPLRRNGRHDLDAMADALTDRTKVVLVCTPNNPTGPVVTAAELEDFLDRVPTRVLVVLDEAYVEFVRDPSAARGLEAMAGRPNVVVLRTFSKAYGLAGLRIGYAIAPEEVADAIATTTQPFAVSDVAQAAALASLQARDELLGRVASVVAEREAMRDSLLEQGWPIPEAQGNFLWLPLGRGSADFATACAPVMVRAFAGEGVRVTVGDPGVNARVLDAVDRWSRPRR
ncbi:histidinol-phosphate transaminase [Aeromicrobium sp. CF3.5]|uniref:histidinol-phosphate transaminase n=1 Tax=Aeromicrobium sp. CF3.5 TaxID=3373078 RepID=UPI003EE59D3C